MPITVQFVNDGDGEVFVPAIICDTCEERILDIDAAMYAFNIDPDRGDGMPRFAHKGRCLTRVETEIRVARGTAGTDDLRAFLTNLANSMNPAWPRRALAVVQEG